MKLVLIEWIDSCSCPSSAWKPLDELGGGAVRCRSVGWLAHEDKSSKTLVAHLSGESDPNVRTYAKGELTIPTRAILRTKVLRS